MAPHAHSLEAAPGAMLGAGGSGLGLRGSADEYAELRQDRHAGIDPPSRNPSVTSSVATFNVEELYERNASKLRMLEDLEQVDDVDEIDRKLNHFLSTTGDSVSNQIEEFSELDYGRLNVNISEMMVSEPERLSTPCLPAESDWIR